MKSFIKVLVSNFWVMLMGILITLIIPRYLGPVQYGYYQLYTFYASFLGLFLLGYCDGIYLKFGGIEYKELDNKKFNQFFNFLLVYLLLLSFLLFSILKILNLDIQNLAVLLSITLFLQGLNSYFVLVNQASGRFTVYSIANTVEKLLLLVYASYVFFTGKIDLNLLFLFTISGKALTLLINMIFDYNLVLVKRNSSFFPDKKQIFENIRIGFPLTLAGVVSMLMTGIGKNKVQSELGIREFGYYSLVFSMMSIVSQVISAISIVFYPLLKKKSIETMKKNLVVSISIFEYVSVLFPLSFYAIYVILFFYLPDYLPATSSLILLLPTLFYQSKISIIYNTFFKVLRMEKVILKNGLISLIFCVILTNLFFLFIPSVESIAIATLISFVFWESLSKKIIYKRFDISTTIISIEDIYFVIYIVLSLTLSIELSALFYFVLIGLYIVFKRKQIFSDLKLILKRSK